MIKIKTMNKVIILAAPSGSGKTTIAKYILSKFNNIQFSISATTRNPRGNEINGKDYYFLSINEFQDKILKKEFYGLIPVYL